MRITLEIDDSLIEGYTEADVRGAIVYALTEQRAAAIGRLAIARAILPRAVARKYEKDSAAYKRALRACVVSEALSEERQRWLDEAESRDLFEKMPACAACAGAKVRHDCELGE